MESADVLRTVPRQSSDGFFERMKKTTTRVTQRGKQGNAEDNPSITKRSYIDDMPLPQIIELL
jgi:hypothetical protein